MRHRENFMECECFASTCCGWYFLLGPSELLSQSTDEIFSITIAASLREEGATDSDPLLFSCTVIFFSMLVMFLNNCCQGCFCWSFLYVPTEWISDWQVAWQYKQQYGIDSSVRHWLKYKPRFLLQICNGCHCNDSFFYKNVFPAWISLVESNPEVTLGIKASFYFFSFFFFLVKVLKNRWRGDSARCCIQYMGFHVINWTLFIYECTLFFGYSGEKLPLAAQGHFSF